MMPTRLTRTLASYGLGFSFILSLLLIPSAALGATPGWILNANETALLPAAVTPDDDGNLIAGYSISIKNMGTSNIAQLAVTAFFDQPYVAPSEPDDLLNPFPPGGANPTAANLTPPVFAKAYINGREVSNACPQPWDAPVMCSLGSLKRNQTATLVVAYEALTMDPAGIHAWWESTGGGSSFCTSGDESHGDCLAQHIGGTTFSDTPGDYGGRFVLDNAVVSNAPVNGSSNPQQIRTFPPKTGIAVTVADGNAIETEPECPAPFTCGLEDGTAEIHVGDGSNQYGLIKVEIEYDKSLLTGINFQKLTVIHIHDDGSFHEIAGSRSCLGNKECVTFSNIPGGGGLMTGYFEQNGFVKYH